MNNRKMPKEIGVNLANNIFTPVLSKGVRSIRGQAPLKKEVEEFQNKLRDILQGNHNDKDLNIFLDESYDLLLRAKHGLDMEKLANIKPFNKIANLVEYTSLYSPEEFKKKFMKVLELGSEGIEKRKKELVDSSNVVRFDHVSLEGMLDKAGEIKQIGESIFFKDFKGNLSFEIILENKKNNKEKIKLSADINKNLNGGYELANLTTDPKNKDLKEEWEYTYKKANKATNVRFDKKKIEQKITRLLERRDKAFFNLFFLSLYTSAFNESSINRKFDEPIFRLKAQNPYRIYLTENGYLNNENRKKVEKKEEDKDKERDDKEDEDEFKIEKRGNEPSNIKDIKHLKIRGGEIEEYDEEEDGDDILVNLIITKGGKYYKGFLIKKSFGDGFDYVVRYIKDEIQEKDISEEHEKNEVANRKREEDLRETGRIDDADYIEKYWLDASIFNEEDKNKEKNLYFDGNAQLVLPTYNIKFNIDKSGHPLAGVHGHCDKNKSHVLDYDKRGNYVKHIPYSHVYDPNKEIKLGYNKVHYDPDGMLRLCTPFDYLLKKNELGMGELVLSDKTYKDKEELAKEIDNNDIFEGIEYDKETGKNKLVLFYLKNNKNGRISLIKAKTSKEIDISMGDNLSGEEKKRRRDEIDKIYYNMYTNNKIVEDSYEKDGMPDTGFLNFFGGYYNEKNPAPDNIFYPLNGKIHDNRKPMVSTKTSKKTGKKKTIVRDSRGSGLSVGKKIEDDDLRFPDNEIPKDCKNMHWNEKWNGLKVKGWCEESNSHGFTETGCDSTLAVALTYALKEGNVEILLDLIGQLKDIGSKYDDIVEYIRVLVTLMEKTRGFIENKDYQGMLGYLEKNKLIDEDAIAILAEKIDGGSGDFDLGDILVRTIPYKTLYDSALEKTVVHKIGDDFLPDVEIFGVEIPNKEGKYIPAPQQENEKSVSLIFDNGIISAENDNKDQDDIEEDKEKNSFNLHFLNPAAAEYYTSKLNSGIIKISDTIKKKMGVTHEKSDGSILKTQIREKEELLRELNSLEKDIGDNSGRLKVIKEGIYQ